MKPRIAVVGGGVLGSVLAHLLSNGADVSLYEEGQLFSRASGMAAGIITLQLHLEHDVKLTRATLAYYRRLQSKGYNLMRRVRGVSLFDEASEPGCAGFMSSRLTKWGVKHRLVGPSEIAEALPGLRVEDTLRGIETSTDYILDTGILQAALREELEAGGVELREYTRVHSVKEEEGVQVHSTAGIEEYDYAVLAMGPWNTVAAGLEGKVFAYHCQAHSIKHSPPNPEVSIYSYTDGIYIVPESPERIIAGDGCKPLRDPAEGLQPDMNITLHVSEKLTHRIPGAGEAELASTWSAPCDVSMDGVPYTGRIPGSRSIYAIGGLDGYGVMRAPGLASILADHLLLGEPIPGLYSVDRLYRYPKPGAIVVNELYNPTCGHRNTCIFKDTDSQWAP